MPSGNTNNNKSSSSFRRQLKLLSLAPLAACIILLTIAANQIEAATNTNTNTASSSSSTRAPRAGGTSSSSSRGAATGGRGLVPVTAITEVPATQQDPAFGTSTGFAGFNALFSSSSQTGSVHRFNNNDDDNDNENDEHNNNYYEDFGDFSDQQQGSSTVEDLLRETCRQSGYEDSTRNARFFPTMADAARYIRQLEAELRALKKENEADLFSSSDDDEDTHTMRIDIIVNIL